MAFRSRAIIIMASAILLILLLMVIAFFAERQSTINGLIEENKRLQSIIMKMDKQICERPWYASNN